MAVDFKHNSGTFVEDKSRSAWHDKALWFVRSKRDIAVMKVENWEQLRKQAAHIKTHCLSNLDKYLIEFEENAKKNGVIVHWANDGDEHNKIVGEILQKHKVKKIVKSKSMLTEECELNPFLEKQGIEVIDTDLGERIIQLREEPPSHIVLPAIHIKKEEVSELFNEKWNTEKGNNDPEYLTYQARLSLRNDFLTADAALTGVNFAVAETGEVVICTNEGNADMGVNITPLQIHSMGLEKVIPKRKHLGIFTRMLARSATGQAITVYTSHFRKPKQNGEMHIIIVDNGRSERLKKDDFWTRMVLDLDANYKFKEIEGVGGLYGIGGLAFTFDSYKWSNSSLDGYSDTSLGLNLGIGLNFKLAEKMSIAPEIRYTIMSGGYLRLGAKFMYSL